MRDVRFRWCSWGLGVSGIAIRYHYAINESVVPADRHVPALLLENSIDSRNWRLGVPVHRVIKAVAARSEEADGRDVGGNLGHPA